MLTVPLIVTGWVFIEIRKRKAGQQITQATRTTEFASLEIGAGLLGEQRQWLLQPIGR
jgi:hypothetical protein